MTVSYKATAGAAPSAQGLTTLASVLPRVIFAIYMVLFFAYLFLPLLVMAAATFNTSKFPTVTPWLGTTLDWFSALWADSAMWQALRLSILISLGVIAISLPVGTAAALFLNSLQDRSRSLFYAVMVSPLLTPGVAIGIATLVLWRQVGVGGGTALIILAQSSFISAYVMLMVAARMQRFDRTLEDAAVDLGASRIVVFRRILLPYLKPSLLAATLHRLPAILRELQHHAFRARHRDAVDGLYRDEGSHRAHPRRQRSRASAHRRDNPRRHRL
jgi:spermidine/putrescine transport system permease protein